MRWKDKTTAQKVLTVLILPPNAPFVLALAAYTIWLLYRQNGYLVDVEELEDTDVEEWMKTTYPNHLKYAIAFFSYLIIVTKTLLWQKETV